MYILGGVGSHLDYNWNSAAISYKLGLYAKNLLASSLVFNELFIYYQK